ncbi:MAG: leucine-rich repeat domain-containing protein [Thermoguttaceae bacterium]|nr:leucine-rich repeat domain-containing protein [Thermoguttaceae bacterium]
MSINSNRCSRLIALCGLCLITLSALGDDRSITPQKSNDGAKYSKDGTMLLFCAKEFKSFTIPSSVTKIGKQAFKGCGSLASITIPSSVKKIGDGAFEACPELTIIAKRGSTAWKYTKKNKIPVQEPEKQ